MSGEQTSSDMNMEISKMRKTRDQIQTKKLQRLVGKHIQSQGEIWGIIRQAVSIKRGSEISLIIDDEWEGQIVIESTSLLGGVDWLKKNEDGKLILEPILVAGRDLQWVLKKIL